MFRKQGHETVLSFWAIFPAISADTEESPKRHQSTASRSSLKWTTWAYKAWALLPLFLFLWGLS
jgi:hypothetical protein